MKPSKTAHVQIQFRRDWACTNEALRDCARANKAWTGLRTSGKFVPMSLPYAPVSSLESQIYARVWKHIHVHVFVYVCTYVSYTVTSCLGSQFVHASVHVCMYARMCTCADIWVFEWATPGPCTTSIYECLYVWSWSVLNMHMYTWRKKRKYAWVYSGQRSGHVQ